MTPVTEIYDLFLKHLGKDDLLEIDESVLEDLLESYLYVSISNICFSFQVNSDLK